MRVIREWQSLPKKTRSYLLGRRWEFASENHDDDFHTDVLFLRVSCGAMARFAGVANRSVVSFHDGYDARFFYDETENPAVIRAMVERYLSDRAWRESIPAAIRETAAALDAVWSGLRSPAELRELDWEALEALYARQLEAHLKLYEPAWTAEALQAAGKGITEALLRRLLDLMNRRGVARESLFDVFNALTVSDELSAFGADQDRLLAAALAIHADPALRAKVLAYPTRARLYFGAPVLRLARAISDGSGALAYHGFAARRRATEEDVLDQLVQLVCDDERREREVANRERRALALRERVRLERELGLSPDEISLFRVYAELGNTKVLRRMVQLHNFEYLDALLRELAIRLEADESALRFLTPEEVFDCFRTRRLPDEARSGERAESMTFVLHQGEEFLLVGDASRSCRGAIAIARPESDGRLSGVPVSGGRARGRAVLAVRNDESLHRRFRAGDILISVETDPDLVPVMRKAAAIVTDQGGITSHAAIIARELGVPCVTGVAGATTTIREGDILTVDAHLGTVEIVDKEHPATPARRLHALGAPDRPGFELTGAKAGVLHGLAAAGHPVPEGFSVLDPAPLDAIPAELARIGAARWAVRSSATCEDGAENSHAGRFTTRLNVPTAEVPAIVAELQRARTDRADAGGDFKLPLLVMRMVDATASGVIFTVDPRQPASGRMVIETAEGLCDALVSGRNRPRCAYADAATGELSGDTWLSATQARALLDEVARLRETLGEKALDIEFSFVGERLYVLQARPVSRAQFSKGER